MPIDPFLPPLLSQIPPSDLTQVEDFAPRREELRELSWVLAGQLADPAPEVAVTTDVELPMPGGSIALRVYRPDGVGPHPAHLYIHGGGWINMSINDAFVDITCRERCAGASCVVISVGYRLAPEHPFPAALDDCYAALEWVHTHADELGIDPGRVSVGGASAGGNLAAAVALRARDGSGPPIAFQLLEVPALDITLSLPSHRAYGSGYALNFADTKVMRQLYVPNPEDYRHPYVSPLLADDLTGLPPAHIMTAEFDMLRDDGERYAERLTEAGVAATLSLQLGHVHNSSPFTKVMAASRAWREEMLTVLRAAGED